MAPAEQRALSTMAHTVLGLLLFLGVSSGAQQQKLPHIIMMLADDLGNYDVGFHNPLAKTPNIDALAADGVILERHCESTRSPSPSPRRATRSWSSSPFPFPLSPPPPPPLN